MNPFSVDDAHEEPAQPRLRKPWLRPTMATVPVAPVASLLLVSPPDGRCCDTGAPPPCFPPDVPLC